MSQPYNIGNLGQKLTVDLAGNVVSLSTTVNAAALTIGAPFIANTTQITIAGVPLTANGSNGQATYVLTSNGNSGSPYWSSVTVGASYVQNTDSRTLSGNLNFTGTNVYFTAANFGSVGTGTGGVVANTTNLFVGNNSVNTNITAGSITLNGTSVLTSVGAAYVQNTDSRTLSGNLNFTGTNVYFTAANFGSVGTGTGGIIANTTTLFVGNNTVNAIVNNSGFYTGATGTGTGGVVANTTTIFVGNNTVNAVHTSSSFTINGTAVVANGTGVWTTGTVNAATISSSATFTANATLVNTAAINVTGQVNTATFYATTSANIASAVQANATGVWTTGTVNAAAHSVGTGFVANTTTLNANTDVILTVNAKNLKFATVNTLAFSYFTQQNDDNFVFYTTNTAYGARAVWSIYANNITSNLNIAVRTQFNGGLYIPTGVTLLDSTGAQGTAGQVLTTNGTGNVYWSSVSGGSPAATYVQNTDSRTLSGNLNFTGTNVYFTAANFGSIGAGTGGVVVNTTNVFVGNNTVNTNITAGSVTLNGTAVLTSVGATYVQNTDSRTLSGNLNFTGANSYFSSKVTHAANVVLNAGISVIDSTGSQGTTGQALLSNGTSNVYWGAPTATVGASYVQNTDSRTLSGNLNFTGTNVYFTAANFGSIGTGTGGIVANTTTVFVGNNTVNTNITAGSVTLNGTAVLTSVGAAYVQNTDSRTLSGNLNFTGTNVYFTAANFGSIGTGTGGIVANTTTVFVGNNTINTTHTSAGFFAVNATGNVAVSPNYLFMANSSSQLNISSTYFLMGTSSQTISAGQISVANNSGNVQITAGTTSILTTGKVGIGKTSASVQLDLIANTNGNDGAWFYNSSTGASAQAVVTVQTNGASGLALGQGYTAKNAFLYLADNAKMELSTNATVAMTIAANGNIGIGSSVTNIKSPLTITPTLYQTGNPTPNKLRLYDDGANNYYAMGVSTVGGMDLISAGPTTLSFVTQSTNAIYSFAKFSNNQLVLNGTDGTAALLLAGATKAVRIFPSGSGTYIEGVDNTGVGSYQTLVIGGSQVSMTISNVEKAKLDSSGNFTIPSQPMCQANNLTYTASYVNGQVIGFTAGYDPRSMFGSSNNTFTVPVAGRYMIHFDFLLDTTSLASLGVSLYKNGSSIKRMYTDKPAYTGVADGYYMASLTHIVNAAASDYFQAVSGVGTMGSPMKIFGDGTAINNIGGFTIYLIG